MNTNKAQEIKNTTALVKYILEEDKKARNSDSFLYFRVLKHIGAANNVDLDSMSVFSFLLNLKGSPFPCFESVRRARQRLQEKNPDLAASDEVKAYRDENEAAVREFVRGEA